MQLGAFMGQSGNKTRKKAGEIITSKQQSAVHLFEDVPDSYIVTDTALANDK
jgi:hypothetical protein